MGNSKQYPIPVSTPNGPGLLIGRGAEGYLVRHPKGAPLVHPDECKVQSVHHVNGLLAWYKEIKNV